MARGDDNVRMHRTLSPLAWWRFAPRRDRVETDNICTESGALLAAEALKTLSRHGLLHAQTMEIKSWRQPGNKVSASLVAVRLASATEESIRGSLDRESKHRSAFPTRVGFHGTGNVYDEAENVQTVDDLVVLSLSMDVELAVQVSTNVDIWLPYDLRAREQRSISERNRPRLTAALLEISALDVMVSSSEITKFAVTDNLHVRNHTNSFGQPVPVLPL